jgi:Lon protease-like protein
MVDRCVADRSPFGVVLIDEGQEVGGDARPHQVGTAARIMRVDRLEDGCMNITAVGTQRFRVQELSRSHSYLSGKVSQFPLLNGATRQAADLAQRVRPLVLDYVDLLAKASNTNLRLDRLPEDPPALAFLIAIALQVKAADKQKLLEQAGIPEILALEARLIAREIKLMQFMLQTQQEVLAMNSGPTGYVFPN